MYKISLIKNVFKENILSSFLCSLFSWRKRSVWIFYAKNSPLVANDFYYGVANYFLCCDCYRRKICCCQMEKERWLPSSMRLLLAYSQCKMDLIALRENFVDFRKCWDFTRFVQSQELIYSKIMFLKFWMIFAKSLSFVYDEIFHKCETAFLHPKGVEMKNSFLQFFI